MTSGKIYAALTGVAVMAASFVVSAQVPADAQVVRIPQASPDRLLPPFEVAGIVQSAGFDPLGMPVLRGVTYRLRAIDRAGRDLSVVVDARYGDILLVERADGPYPEPRIAAIPHGYDEPEIFDRRPDTYSNVRPPSPRAVKPASAPRTATVPADKHPPLPKPRPEALASQTATPMRNTPAAAPPAPKPETAPAQDAPTKWKDEPAPTNTPAAAPQVPDVTPLE